MDIEEIKHYMRVDGNDDDAFIASLIEAAKLYITNATGVTVDKANPLHKLAVSILCLHWYENRLANDAEGSPPMNFSVESIMNQIALTSVNSGGQNVN